MRNRYWDEERHRLRRTPESRARIAVAAALVPVTLIALALGAGLVLEASSTLVALGFAAAVVGYGLLYGGIYRQVLERPPNREELMGVLRQSLRPPGR